MVTKMIYTTKNAPCCAVYLRNKRKVYLFSKKECFQSVRLDERRVTIWVITVLNNELFKFLTLRIKLLHNLV